MDSPSSLFSRQFLYSLSANLPIAALLHLAKQKSLTSVGLFHATALGIGLWASLGFPGWLVGVIYFVVGSVATKVKMAEKQRLGIAEKRDGARGPENVWGSAATAMTCAALSAIAPPQYSQLFKIGFVTAFATKLADTLSSELGKAYGHHAYLITALKPVPRGTEGAVSVEGTLSGLLAGLFMATISLQLGLIVDTNHVMLVTISSFIATTFESYLGVLWQGKQAWRTNEMVNFIMTVVGAIISMSLYMIFDA